MEIISRAYAPVLLLAPGIIHLIGILLDRIKPLGISALKHHLAEAGIDQKILANRALFDYTGDFLKFEEEVHFILSLIVFCMISLLVNQIEFFSYTGVLLSLVFAFVLLVFITAFIFQLSNHRFKIGDVHATEKWRQAAYGAVGCTFCAEVFAQTISQ